MNKETVYRLFGLALLIGLLVFVGQQLRHQFGISFSLETAAQFNSWIESLGWIGPLGFVVLVVSRLFIGLSSHIVLILGGIAFGVAGGVSATLAQYLVARLFTDRLREQAHRVRAIGGSNLKSVATE